jgi:hypothetical protein
MSTAEITILREDKDITLYIEGEYHNQVKGIYRSAPEDCYPDEPAYCDIDGVYTDEACSVKWTGKLTFEEIEMAEEAFREATEAYKIDRHLSREDFWQDRYLS